MQRLTVDQSSRPCEGSSCGVGYLNGTLGLQQFDVLHAFDTLLGVVNRSVVDVLPEWVQLGEKGFPMPAALFVNGRSGQDEATKVQVQ